MMAHFAFHAVRKCSSLPRGIVFEQNLVEPASGDIVRSTQFVCCALLVHLACPLFSLGDLFKVPPPPSLFFALVYALFCSPVLRIQVDGSSLESVASDFHRTFARNDYFKLGCALCVLLKDQLLTRTQVRPHSQRECFPTRVPGPAGLRRRPVHAAVHAQVQRALRGGAAFVRQRALFLGPLHAAAALSLTSP